MEEKQYQDLTDIEGNTKIGVSLTDDKLYDLQDQINKTNDELNGILDKANSYTDYKVENEAQARTAADTLLQSRIDQEVYDRTEADNDILNKLKNETNERIDSDNKLKATIGNEISRATAAEKDLQNQINAEIERATKAEGNLEFNKDIKNEDGIQPDNLTDAINIVDKKYLNQINEIIEKLEHEIHDRVEMDEALNKYLKEEINAREKADGSLEFDDDIRNEDGGKPCNLTDAINAVNRKYNSLLTILIGLKAEVEAIREALNEND